jgi:long-chain fatty acid transport protein
MKAKRVAVSIASAAACALPAVAQAQGFGLNEIGSCAVGRGFAATGATCDDASVIYWNPAAATELRGVSVYGGGASIAVTGEFIQDYTGRAFPGKVPSEYPPHGFVSYHPAPRVALGVGVYVPYGLTSQWEADFPGRFQSRRASLATIYAQPNLAFEIVPGKLSFGIGPVVGFSTIELQQGLDLSTLRTSAAATAPTFGQLGIPAGTQFAEARLKGNSVGVGFNAGVKWRPTPALQLGARYLSRVHFEYDEADAQFRQTPTNLILPGALPGALPANTSVDALVAPQFVRGTLVAQKVQSVINHPAQAQVGAGYTFRQSTTVSLDYAWIGWSSFDVLPVRFLGPASVNNRDLIEDYGDSQSIRTGIEHRLFDAIPLRAGFAYVKSPAPDETVTALLPDQDRKNYSLGFGLPVGRFTLDAAYLRVDTDGRRGRVTERMTEAETAVELNSGFYRLDANIYSVSLKALF